jgi:Ca2+-binding EF-hand superfamily protein
MKMMMSWMLALSLILGLGAASATAADKPKATPEEAFKKLDKNSDGKVSSDEFKGKREGEKADKAVSRFKTLDKDNDGFLTLEEFKAGATKKKK